MARVNLAVFSTTVPSAVIPPLPYLFKSTAHMRRALDGPVGERILADLEDQGLVGLCFYDAGARSFYSAKKPIRSAADMKGMKVRVQQGDAAAVMVRALGGHRGADVIPKSLRRTAGGRRRCCNEQHAILCHFPPLPGGEVYSLTEHSMAPGVLVFSKQVWDTLSKDDQAIIRAAAKESILYMRTLWDASEKSMRILVEAGGAQIIGDIDSKPFADALLPLHPVLVTAPRLRNMATAIQAAD